MRFFTLIHISSGEQSMHNNSFATGFEQQIGLYLTCAKQLHRSLAAEGIELVVLTNDAAFLQRLNADGYGIAIVQLDFTLNVPSGIKFYSAHFKLEVFGYLASLKDDYIALVDSDILCINPVPNAFRLLAKNKWPLYYDITDQVTPAYGAEAVIADKERISGKPSIGLWAGGEFLAGPPSFFQTVFAEVSGLKEAYFAAAATAHHQGDEVLTSVAIENLKIGGANIFDAGALSLIGRYWSYVPLHQQKPVEAYKNHFLIHLPSDKKFIAGLKGDELRGEPFFSRYRRHLSVARTVNRVFKTIKPYAKRIRSKFAF